MEAEPAPPPPEAMEVGNIPPADVPVKQIDAVQPTEADANVEQTSAADSNNDVSDALAATEASVNGNGNGTSASDDLAKDPMEEPEPSKMEDPLPSEAAPEEPVSSEANNEAPKDAFDSMLASEPSDSKPESKAEGENETVEEEDKKEGDAFDKVLEGGSDEAKKDEDEEAKDSFDKMLSGESESVREGEEKPSTSSVEDGDAAAPKEETAQEDNNEDKKDAPVATTIAGDPLEEMKDEDEVVVTMTSEKVPSDEKYYEDLKPEELEWLNDNMPSVETVYSKLTCTVCSKNVDPLIGTNKGVLRHPHLGICLCRDCRKFYGDGDWPRTEDGDEYCRMCGQGGDILLCDKCPNAFCKKCLTRNLGSRALREITKSEEWNCLVCDSSPIFSLKAIYYCVFKKQDEIKELRAKDREKEKAKKARKSDGVSAKEKEALVKSPQNFLEENISEAFKTLEVYQKSLETERTRCIKTVKEGMTVEMATSITRKLRKLYAVTQKNMDLLDRAIVESFVENFPTESTRIHMGRMAPAAEPSGSGPGRKKKILKQKIKIKGKKKKQGGVAPKAVGRPRGRKKKVIQMNGSPVYREADDLVVPSLMGNKKKRKKYAESDVECIDVSENDSDAEYYAPKKRSKPGPASSKRKPGPASKKKVGPKSKTNYY